MAYSSLIHFSASSAVAVDFHLAWNFRQYAAFTFSTEQSIVTCERIHLQDTPEEAKVLPRGVSPLVRLVREPWHRGIFEPEFRSSWT